MNPSPEIFDQVNKKLKNRLMCIKSQCGSSRKVKLTPIFLYHAPRTSGLAFYFALKYAIEFMCQLADISESPPCRRLESINFEVTEAFVKTNYPKGLSLISSHDLFGVHKKLLQNFKLVTIVREPYSRLRSAYLSSHMRAQTSPALDNFAEFLKTPENQNSTIRQICNIPGSEDVSTKHLDDAIRRLNDEFDAFITTQDTNDLIGYYLSSHGLPNLLMEKPNQTKGQYQLDVSEYRDFIRQNNQLDNVLFEFVRNNRRLPKHHPDTDTISPVTVIVRENPDYSDCFVQAVCTNTLSINQMLTENPAAFGDLNLFWSTIPNPIVRNQKGCLTNSS